MQELALPATAPRLETLKQKQAGPKSVGRPPSGRNSNRPQSSTRQVTLAVVSRQSNTGLMQIHGQQVVSQDKQPAAPKTTLKGNKYLRLQDQQQPLQNLKSLHKASLAQSH